MKKYFVKAETEWAGTQCYELIEAENEKVAEQQAQEIAMNNYESLSLTSRAPSGIVWSCLNACFNDWLMSADLISRSSFVTIDPQI